MKNNKKENNRINIDEYNTVLDRIIGFVCNCDTKASIMLALFGVLFTVLCTSHVTDSIIDIINNLKEDIGGGECIYIMFVVIAIVLIASSVIELVLVLVAKVDKSGYDSKIYFKDISENIDFCRYRKKIKKMSENKYIDDIISQIYINAKICTKKYERYNVAIKLGVLGTILFIMLYFIGIVLY